MVDFIKRGQERLELALEQQRYRPGYVYIVLGKDGLYKIGRTFNLDKRRQELIRDYDAVLVHSIKCKRPIQAELDLHRRFANKRIRGEWFALVDQDITEIKAIERI